MKFLSKSYISKLIVTTFCLILAALAAFAQSGEAYRGTLDELRGKQYAALVVTKLSVVSAGEPERGIVAAALAGKKSGGRRLGPALYAIAKPLDDYSKKTKKLIPVRKVSDADYVIFFNLLEYRRILDTNYPYGELYVVVKTPAGTQPAGRIIWRSAKIQFAGDAVKELLKAFKAVYGNA